MTAIEDETSGKSQESEKKGIKKEMKNSIKKFGIEDDIKETSLSDFIPLKTYS